MRDSRDFAMDGEYTAFTFILLITIEDIVCSSGRCEMTNDQSVALQLEEVEAWKPTVTQLHG